MRTRYRWLWAVLYAAGIGFLLSRCSYGSTPPGTLITLRAEAWADNCKRTNIERQVIVASPAGYTRPVYVCPYNQQLPGERPAVVDRPPWAAGWKVKRLLNYGAGCPGEVVGVQTIDGSIWTEHGVIE